MAAFRAYSQFMDKASADGLGFRLHRVSFSGGVGAVMALACIITIMDVPVMRWAVLAVPVGAVFGVGLVYVRRR